jgi:hypothetical protein
MGDLLLAVLDVAVQKPFGRVLSDSVGKFSILNIINRETILGRVPQSFHYLVRQHLKYLFSPLFYVHNDCLLQPGVVKIHKLAVCLGWQHWQF